MKFHDSFDSGLKTLLQWDPPDHITSFDQMLEYISFVETGSRLGYSPIDWTRGKSPNLESFRDRWNRHNKETKQVLSKLRNRTFCIAEGRRPVLGPHTAQRGDEIFLLEGGKMCYVLRRTGKAGVYRLVGDCVLLGYMQKQDNCDIHAYCVRDGEAHEGAVQWTEILIV
ncbi:hypothetical protein BR93DRAFT_189601 [Coniochaeta sp. PMI_546]|nr:hypothetical protein BR93DRAFT_189601 [Coniochaeta sp. PMI_546]